MKIPTLRYVTVLAQLLSVKDASQLSYKTAMSNKKDTTEKN